MGLKPTALLIELKTCSTRGNYCLVLNAGSKPLAREMRGPRGEQTVVVLLFMLLNYILDSMFLSIELNCSQP